MGERHAVSTFVEHEGGARAQLSQRDQIHRHTLLGLLSLWPFYHDACSLRTTQGTEPLDRGERIGRRHE